MSLIDNQDFNLNYVSYVPMCLILSKHLLPISYYPLPIDNGEGKKKNALLKAHLAFINVPRFGGQSPCA